MRDLIAEVRSIDVGLTAGPWFSVVNDMVGGRAVQTVDLPVSKTENHHKAWVADMIFRDQDAELIVRLRNLLPALVEELEAARARIAELEGERDEARGDAGQAHGQAGALHARVMELRAQVTARDARIAELEAEQGPTAGYVVGCETSSGWSFARMYGGPTTREEAERELAEEIQDGGPELDWALLRVVLP